jgi:hypothetical protein
MPCKGSDSTARKKEVPPHQLGVMPADEGAVRSFSLFIKWRLPAKTQDQINKVLPVGRSARPVSVLGDTPLIGRYTIGNPQPVLPQ